MLINKANHLVLVNSVVLIPNTRKSCEDSVTVMDIYVCAWKYIHIYICNTQLYNFFLINRWRC